MSESSQNQGAWQVLDQGAWQDTSAAVGKKWWDRNAGVILMIMAFTQRSKIRFVLENGQFVVGKIIDKRKFNKQKGCRSSANRNFRITYAYSADGEELRGKALVSAKIGDSVNVEQEIPVICTSFGTKFKAYSPMLLNVEFNN